MLPRNDPNVTCVLSALGVVMCVRSRIKLPWAPANRPFPPVMVCDSIGRHPMASPVESAERKDVGQGELSHMCGDSRAVCGDGRGIDSIISLERTLEGDLLLCRRRNGERHRQNQGLCLPQILSGAGGGRRIPAAIRSLGYLLRQQSRSTRSPRSELRTKVSCRVGKRELEHLSRAWNCGEG